MQVMLLAAGRGATSDELSRQIDYLAREGADLVVVNAEVPERGYLCGVEVVDEPELLGSAGAVRGGLQHFERHLPIVVVESDSAIDAPLRRIVGQHIESGAAATICATWLPETGDKDAIEVDVAGNVVGVEPAGVGPRPGLVSAGLVVLDRELAALIPPGVYCDLPRDLFPLALDLELGLRVEPLQSIAPVTTDPLGGLARTSFA
jgi:NDP-sugar pyrophosphorylase family protein